MAAMWKLQAASTSGASVTAHGFRILDVREPDRPWGSSVVTGGVVDAEVEDEGEEEEEGEGGEGVEAAMARARGCDVYVGYVGSGGGRGARRMVAWLRAELEMLGVPCVAADRARCGDAPAHAAARAAMEVAAAGVVVVTPASLASPYAVEEIRAFMDRGALVPVLLGLARADLVSAEHVVARRGAVWAKHGGQLWKLYDGAEGEWREAVEGLARAEPAVEVAVGAGGGGLRGRILDVLEIVGARLGRRAVGAAVAAWRAAADLEVPLPVNAAFVGRVRELTHVEAVLRGGAQKLARVDKAAARRAALLDEPAVVEGPFIDGVICISGASGAGKTELALEFAHRHGHEYKKVLWVQGEARYLRQSYLALADQLGVAVGDDVSSGRVRSLHDIEGDAIAKIKKELARDIPYLIVIDNLESEKDWWDGRTVQELLPRGVGKRTHVVVTTRLPRLQGVRTLELGNLTPSESMRLMKGTGIFSVEDMAILRAIEQKVGRVPLGLALVGAMLAELSVAPAEIHGAMLAAPHRAPTWESRDDAVLRGNPGLVQLLDACFAVLDREAPRLGAAAARLLEACSFFAPAPIPVALLASAASACAADEPLWKRLKRTLQLSCSSARAAGGGHAEPLATLLRLGIVRPCARAGCVSVHGVFRLFSRKVVGSGKTARAVVRAIAAAQGAGGCGGAGQHANDDHTWAACLSLFRFQAPAVAAELPPAELPRFVTRSVLPLAARCVASYSAYSAALEMLREATDGVRDAEDRYVAGPRRGNGGGGGGNMELDLRVYQELARARAALLAARARMMARAGERAIAEDHCLAAISILEVVCGDDHPETQAVRAFLEQAVGAQAINSSDSIRF